MATLQQRIEALATAVGNHLRDNVAPRLLPANGASGPGPHGLAPGATAGQYLSAALDGSALSTVAAAANRLDAYPFIPARTITVDELAVEVSTAVAASQARIGIYSANASGLPDALLTGQGTLLDCASTGAKASPVSALTLVRGTVYWLAVLSSSTQTYRALPVAALMSLGHAATGTTNYTLRRATQTFASGLPASFPANTLNNTLVPWLRLRLA